ncbi:MAG: hypothetical protein ABIS92_17145 [Polyangia bacterium]
MSRVTVRRSTAAAPPSTQDLEQAAGSSPVPGRLGDALRASREALLDIQRQLDSLLLAVRAPGGRPAVDSADRLRRATKRAGTAIHRLASA